MKKSGRKNKGGKSLVALTLIYALCIFIFCFAVIAHLDASIVTHNSSRLVGARYNGTSKGTKDLIKSGIPSGAEDISFSYDDKYYAYLYNSEIYVVDIGSNKLVKKIQDKSGIKKLTLMGNRNIIMYFIIENGNLKLETYNIDSGLTTVQKSFSIPKNSKIKSVDYSSITNLIYINMEQDSSKNESDTIYYLNIMKVVKRIAPGHTVNNMLLANSSLGLYFEDDDNNLYDYSKPVPGVNKASIIGSDENDNVYARSIDDKGTIYVIKNDSLIKTLKLDDLNFIRFYTDKSNVYAVYKNYIINLTSNARLSYSSDLKFMGMGGQNVYFVDSNNNIAWIKRTI